jgi:hypothetical protein
VTEAPQSRASEIGQRQRRYLLMMGLRLVCFVVTVVAFVNHAGWLTVIPAFGAIALPYFAVVIANSRRPASASGFQPYEPRLPERYHARPTQDGPTQDGSTQGSASHGDTSQGGTSQGGAQSDSGK